MRGPAAGRVVLLLALLSSPTASKSKKCGTKMGTAILRARGHGFWSRGDFQSARRCLELLAERDSHDVATWSDLGSVNTQLGSFDQALESYYKALSISPSALEAINGLGVVSARIGNYPQAVSYWSRAVDVDGGFETVATNLAEGLRRMGQNTEAIRVLMRLLTYHAPLDAGAFSMVGILLRETSPDTPSDTPLRAYRAAMRLQPRSAEFAYRLGNARLAGGDTLGAVGSYRSALRLDPSLPAAYNNLGNALQQLGALQPAVEAFDKAVTMLPSESSFWCNYGSALQVQSAERSTEAYLRALSVEPTLVEAMGNMANALSTIGSFDVSRRTYIAALRLTQPGAVQSTRLLQSTQPGVIQSRRLRSELMSSLLSCCLQLCDWDSINLFDLEHTLVTAASKDIALGRRPSLTPFYANLLSSVSAVLQRAISAAFAIALHADFHSDMHARFRRSYARIVGGSPICIGVLSSDLTNHVVGHGIASLLKHINPQKFRVECFASASDSSDVRAAIEARAAAVHDIERMAHHDVALLINRHKVTQPFALLLAETCP